MTRILLKGYIQQHVPSPKLNFVTSEKVFQACSYSCMQSASIHSNTWLTKGQALQNGAFSSNWSLKEKLRLGTYNVNFVTTTCMNDLYNDSWHCTNHGVMLSIITCLLTCYNGYW